MTEQPDDPPLLLSNSSSRFATPELQERLRDGAVLLGVQLDARQLERLDQYFGLLLEWNHRFNLTAIADPAEVIDKHFLDSLSCVAALDLSRCTRVVDVGTGAGFPGLVLKIAFPHLDLLLLDSVEKRLRFLKRVVEALDLSGVQTLHARAEDAAHDPSLRESFDLATARAVARLNTLAEYCLPFVRVGGSFLAMKGPEIQEELVDARSALSQLGGGTPTVQTLTLPGTSIGRSLVLVLKTKPTPPAYPRHPGTPKKHPLG